MIMATYSKNLNDLHTDVSFTLADLNSREILPIAQENK